MRIPSESDAVKRFQTAMDDDINTSSAIAVLFELAKDLQKEGNRLTHEGKSLADAHTLRYQWQTLVVLAQVLGLEATAEVSGEGTVSLQGGGAVLDVTEIEALIQKRKEARQAKNWAEGDRIRDELKEKGVILVDKPGGVTEWHWE